MRIQWIVEGVFGSEEAGFTATLASNRYRAILPAQAMRDLGHAISFLTLSRWDPVRQTLGQADAVIVGKVAPGGDPKRVALLCDRALSGARTARQAGIAVLVDVNDDHFDRADVGAYWRTLVQLCSVVTVGSESMRERVRSFTGRPVVLVGDPVASPLVAPRVWNDRTSRWWQRLVARPTALRLVWYGHLSNWPAMQAWLDPLASLTKRHPWHLVVVTTPDQAVVSAVQEFQRRHAHAGSIEIVPWSEEAQWREVQTADVVLLPSDPSAAKKAVKTANRLTDALHAGRYVVAAPIPAYLPFAGNVALCEEPVQALRGYVQEPALALEKITNGQRAVVATFSALAVGGQWNQAIQLAAAQTEAGIPGLQKIRSGAGGREAVSRVLIFSLNLIPTLQIAWMRPLKKAIEESRVRLGIITETDLAKRFPGLHDEQAMLHWVEAKLRKFNPQVAVFCRFGGIAGPALLRAVKDRGCVTVYSIDDDLTQVPFELGAEKHAFHSNPDRVASVKYLLQNSDVVDASSSLLVQKLRDSGLSLRQTHLRSYCAGDVIGVQPPAESWVTVGYAGFDHKSDLNMIAGALEALLDACPKVRFELIAPFPIPENLTRFGARVELVAPVGIYADYLKLLLRRRWHIGLCPLGDSEFNRLKNINKWIEYSSVGACVVASAGVIYDDCCGDGAGELVHLSEWLPALERLVASPEARVKMVEKAQDKLNSHYSFGAQSEALESWLRSMIFDKNEA